MLTHIEAITFDLDDTLWDNKPVIAKAVADTEQFINQQNPNGPIDTSALAAAREAVIARSPPLAFDLTSLREQTYQQALLNSGTSAVEARQLAKEATDLFMRLRSQVTPFETAIPTLQTLQKHYRIGAISNGNCQLHTLPIGACFEFWVTPLEAKAAKPNRGIYDYAAQQFALQAYTTLHVGDCLQNDVIGANSAGYQTAWFNPERQNHRHGATIEIHCLTDLVALLC